MNMALPKGWVEVPISSTCEHIRGVSYNKKDVRFEIEKDYLPLLRANNINGAINHNDLQYVPRKIVKEKQLLQKGDVVIAMSSGSKKVVGKTAPIIQEWQGTFGTFCGVLRPIGELKNGLFPYFFRTQDYRNKISELATGTNINNIKTTHFDEINIHLPPLKEQKRIVAKLNAIIPRIDSVKARLDKVPTIIKRFRQSVLTAAVTGKLTEKWRREHAAIGEWVEISSGELFSFVTSGSRGWAKYYSKSGPLFLRIGNLDHDTIKIDTKKKQFVNPPKGAEGIRTRVVENDILISITADVGMIALVPKDFGEAYINQHISLARPTKKINPIYLAWYLASSEGQAQFKNLQKGATKVGLGLNDIKNVKVPMPPLEEQKEIVRRVDKLLALADKLETHYQNAKARIDKLSQSVLAKAFRGELVPQDPNDEPAEKLLKRIMEEKAKMECTLKGARKKVIRKRSR